MKREPGEYVIRGVIERQTRSRFVVRVVAHATGTTTDDRIVETATVGSADEATTKQWELIRVLARRLETAGNNVVQVEADPETGS